MARPKGPTRTQKQLFFDEFCDMPLAEQEQALEHLAEFHRQAKRQASRKWSQDRLAAISEERTETSEEASHPFDALDGVAK